jgi:hypothetical protein
MLASFFFASSLLDPISIGVRSYTNEDALALQVDILDRELVGERHGFLISV